MIEVEGKQYFTPREIADNKMIVNHKGKSDYAFVLRLIRNGVLAYKIFNRQSQIPYYLVEKSEVDKYNAELLS